VSATNKVRINFVGQSTYFQSCALSRETNDVIPNFIDFRSGDDPETLRHRLQSIPCDVIIAFKPEVIPAGLLSDVPGVKIGWFTEPLPRDRPAPSRPHCDPDAPPNPLQEKQLVQIANSDLERRLASAKTVDVKNFDKFIVFDPLISDTVSQFAPVWKALPLPVDDVYFQDVPGTNVPPKVGFFGRPTLHRDLMLGPSLHAFDVRYIAHGVFGEELRDMAFKLDVAINLHNERYPNFENRVSLHLAAGNLVISEPLSPRHGLEPGVDYLEVNTPKELYIALEENRNYPDTFSMMRNRGRQKAEYFRASNVYRALVSDI
jgi:hypothetical protein